MKTVKSPDLAKLISNASAIADQLWKYIVQGDYDQADETSMIYGKLVEEILNFPVLSLGELKLKTGFIFDNLLSGEDNEELLLKYKTILQNDLSTLDRN